MNIRTKGDLEKIQRGRLEIFYPSAAKISCGKWQPAVSPPVQVRFMRPFKRNGESESPHPPGSDGCIGFCQREPVVDIWEPGKPRVFYQGVSPDRCGELVEKWLENKVVEDLLFFTDGKKGPNP